MENREGACIITGTTAQQMETLHQAGAKELVSLLALNVGMFLPLLCGSPNGTKMNR